MEFVGLLFGNRAFEEVSSQLLPKPCNLVLCFFAILLLSLLNTIYFCYFSFRRLQIGICLRPACYENLRPQYSHYIFCTCSAMRKHRSYYLILIVFTPVGLRIILFDVLTWSCDTLLLILGNIVSYILPSLALESPAFLNLVSDILEHDSPCLLIKQDGILELHCRHLQQLVAALREFLVCLGEGL